MIVRDTAGNIHIINRTDCKNDKEYYDKNYEEIRHIKLIPKSSEEDDLKIWSIFL